MTKEKNLFANRVSESDVAKVLQLIAELPNRRNKPIVGDCPGDFDFWFDGGASTIATGVQTFVFTDGCRACVGNPIPALSVTIWLADGRRVDVRQVKDA